MTPTLRKLLFETLYRNRYLYRFASTVPFAGQWRVWQRQVLPRLKGHDILELGCGLGDLLADMIEAGYNCRAVEHSRQMVAAARDTLQRRKVGERSWVIQGSSQRLPFPDENFDTVVSTFPSEYIYDPDTISEVERVLRPGGRLIVIEGANFHSLGLLQPFLMLIQALVYGPSVLRRARPQNLTRNTSTEHPEERIVYPGRQPAQDVLTEVVPNATFGRHIPLERNGLRRRSEIARNRRWEVYITIGEKP